MISFLGTSLSSSQCQRPLLVKSESSQYYFGSSAHYDHHIHIVSCDYVLSLVCCHPGIPIIFTEFSESVLRQELPHYSWPIESIHHEALPRCQSSSHECIFCSLGQTEGPLDLTKVKGNVSRSYIINLPYHSNLPNPLYTSLYSSPRKL